MLLYEFLQKHPASAHSKKARETETRVYFDEETADVIIYQYLFEGPEVLYTNSVTIPIKQIATLSKLALSAYVSMFANSYSIDK